MVEQDSPVECRKMAQSPRRPNIGWRSAAFLVAGVVLAAVYIVAWAAPSIGLYHDDGVYLVSAKALAEGKGYRVISLPSGIPQTKYPFLFPVALSIIWRILPSFPGNVPVLKTFPLICAIGWFVLAYKLLLRMHATKVQAVWIVLLTAASPSVVFLSTNLMSEPLFGFLLMASLLVANTVERSQSDRWAWAAGGLAALAFLTRTAGAPVLIAIPAAFLIQRRYGAAWRFVLTGGPLSCIWPMWVHMHPVIADPMQMYYSAANYGSWNILMNYAIPEKALVFRVNALLSLASPALLLGLHWPILVTAAAFLLILIVLFRKKLVRADAIHLSVAAYIGMVLCWVWPPPRFLVVFLPLILALVWMAVEAVTSNRTFRYATVGVVSVLSCLVLVNDIRRIPQTASSGGFPIAPYATDDWMEMKKVFSWVRNNTKPDAVVLANLDPALYLYTGRKSSRYLVADGYKLFYAGAPTGNSTRSSVQQAISLTNASYLVVTPDRSFAETPFIRRAIGRYLQDNPGSLDLVDRPGSDPEYRIYRIGPGLHKDANLEHQRRVLAGALP